MTVTSSKHFGSATIECKSRFLLDYSFFQDYSHRRVPTIARAFMGIAQARSPHPEGESAARLALDLLQENLKPTQLSSGALSSGDWKNQAADSLKKAGSELYHRARSEKDPRSYQASLLFAIVGDDRAYLGRLGAGQPFLIRERKLIDIPITPGAEAPVEPKQEYTRSLFPTGEEKKEKPPVPTVGDWLGESDKVRTAFTEFDLRPGDILVLCAPQIARGLSREDLVEQLVSARDLQGGCNRIAEIFREKSGEDGGSIVAFVYPHAEKPKVTVTPSRPEKDRARPAHRRPDILLLLLLTFVLLGIFVVGFAVGWKITNALRSPSTQPRQMTSTQEENSAHKENETQAEPEEEPLPEEVTLIEEESETVTFPQKGLISGNGVRLRAESDLNSNVLGILNDHQEVTVLEQVADSVRAQSYKIKAVPTSGRKSYERDGFVKKEYVVVSIE